MFPIFLCTLSSFGQTVFAAGGKSFLITLIPSVVAVPFLEILFPTLKFGGPSLEFVP
jgi:hypothetical protein